MPTFMTYRTNEATVARTMLVKSDQQFSTDRQSSVVLI